jgi:hypothetical protein
VGSVLDIHICSVVGLERIFLQAFGNLDSITEFCEKKYKLRFDAVLNNSGITLISRVEPKRFLEQIPSQELRKRGTFLARVVLCSAEVPRLEIFLARL